MAQHDRAILSSAEQHHIVLTTRHKEVNMITLSDSLNIPSDKAKTKYARVGKGDCTFRFLDKPTEGYLWWDENRTCTRVRTAKEAGDNDAKYFWHFPVWMDEEVKFMEIAQATVIKAILGITKSDDSYADLSGYNIKVTGTGDDKERRYSVVPMPIKPLPAEAAKEWKLAKAEYDPANLFAVVEPVTSDDDDDLPF